MIKNEIVKLGLILLIITSIAGILLGFANLATADVIVAVEEAASSGPEVAMDVVPGSANFEDLDEDLVNKIKSDNEEFIDAKKAVNESGALVGYGIRTLSTVSGYGGDIELFVGISPDGKIVGVRVLSMKETPGLGTKVQNEEFKEQFVGKSVDMDIEIVKIGVNEDNQIQAVAGATTSSTSYTSAVNNALDIFNEYIK
ncbi:MAG: RnfABCDGE type electron transport complex subunit G [Bacillota bacterium]|nr:RnfABCDGE type electron transport complex subunit G [Bacillota bacterium]